MLEGPSSLYLGKKYAKISLCSKDLDLTLKRGREAADKLMHIAQSSTMESGIPRVLGFQVHRFVLATKPSPIPTTSPLLFMKDVLSREPLRRHKMCSHYQGQNRSLAWVFAVTVLQPDFLAELAGFSRQDTRLFTMRTCVDFFRMTAKLLAKARTERIGSVDEEKATLIEHLELIYCLIAYHNVQVRLIKLLSMAETQSLSEVTDLVKERTARHDPKPNSKEAADLSFKVLTSMQLIWAMFIKWIGGDGWDHMQALTRHWLRKLRKLGGKHRRYSQVMVTNFHLNTLCRINHKDEIEDEGQLPQDFEQHFCKNIVVEAYTTFQDLHPLRNEALHSHAEIFVDLFPSIFEKSMDNTSIYCHHQGGCLIMRFASLILDALEEEVTRLEAEKSLDKPKDFMVIPPDDTPDRTLAWSQSNLDSILGKLSKP